MKKPVVSNNSKNLRELINKVIQQKTSSKINKVSNIDFIEADILIRPIDYYYTNAISRSSKTMSECRQINQSPKKTGTDN